MHKLHFCNLKCSKSENLTTILSLKHSEFFHFCTYFGISDLCGGGLAYNQKVYKKTNENWKTVEFNNRVGCRNIEATVRPTLPYNLPKEG